MDRFRSYLLATQSTGSYAARATKVEIFLRYFSLNCGLDTLTFTLSSDVPVFGY